MRKILFLLAALCLCSVASAQTSDILQQADSAYTADNFQEAAAAYQHVINTEGTSAEILYNLGNCYYRMGEFGKAILSYERALRLDPTSEDARNNLEFVNSKIADRPGERGSFLGNALDALSLGQVQHMGMARFCLFYSHTRRSRRLYILQYNSREKNRIFRGYCNSDRLRLLYLPFFPFGIACFG